MSKPKNEFNLSSTFTDSQIAMIVAWRVEGIEWDKLLKKFNAKFETDKSIDAVKNAYRTYGNYFEMESSTQQVKVLQEVRKVKQANSKTARENVAILNYLNEKEEVLEEIREIVAKVKKGPAKGFKQAKLDPSKKNMTLELLLSDLHYGKKTQTFDLAVARRRMKELARTLMGECLRAEKLYNVERFILALIGDIIESETMHGLESSRGSEFGNPKQVQSAIESLFFDMIQPVAQFALKKGIKIDIPAVAGNHDRTESDRTYNNPGENYWTYVIYNTLQLLCQQTGLTNVTFYIPLGSYVDLGIYGNTVLYEHGHNAKASTKAALEALLNNRQTQLKKIIHFLRVGHYHEDAVFGRGRIIVNASLPGPDGYSDEHGFDSQAGQTLNFYVETKERPTCFYRSFPIYLP